MEDGKNHFTHTVVYYWPVKKYFSNGGDYLMYLIYLFLLNIIV